MNGGTNIATAIARAGSLLRAASTPVPPAPPAPPATALPVPAEGVAAATLPSSSDSQSEEGSEEGSEDSADKGQAGQPQAAAKAPPSATPHLSSTGQDHLGSSSAADKAGMLPPPPLPPTPPQRLVPPARLVLLLTDGRIDGYQVGPRGTRSRLPPSAASQQHAVMPQCLVRSVPACNHAPTLLATLCPTHLTPHHDGMRPPQARDARAHAARLSDELAGCVLAAFGVGRGVDRAELTALVGDPAGTLAHARAACVCIRLHMCLPALPPCMPLPSHRMHLQVGRGLSWWGSTCRGCFQWHVTGGGAAADGVAAPAGGGARTPHYLDLYTRDDAPW